MILILSNIKSELHNFHQKYIFAQVQSEVNKIQVEKFYVYKTIEFDKHYKTGVMKITRYYFREFLQRTKFNQQLIV